MIRFLLGLALLPAALTGAAVALMIVVLAARGLIGSP